MSLHDSLILSTVAQCAEVTGLSAWCIAGIKRASRDQADSPWVSRFTTAAKIRRWIFSHPEFVASRQHRKQASTLPPLTLPSTRPRGKNPNPKLNPSPRMPEPETNPNLMPTGRVVGPTSGRKAGDS
jgi:hypothetical protein